MVKNMEKLTNPEERKFPYHEKYRGPFLRENEWMNEKGEYEIKAGGKEPDASISGLAWDCLGPLGAIVGGMLTKPVNNYEDYWQNFNEVKKAIYSAPINIKALAARPLKTEPDYLADYIMRNSKANRPEKSKSENDENNKPNNAYTPGFGRYPIKIADDGHGHIVYIDFGDIGCNNGIGNVQGGGDADIKIGNNYRGASRATPKRANKKLNTLDDIHSASPMYW